MQKTLPQLVEEVDRYPIDAFHFLQQGLTYSVERVHGSIDVDATVSRHISGQQLSEGLREYALLRWGLLAFTVLRRWGITSTMDFGRMVFAMVESGLLQKTDSDALEDFRDVYDFRSAFEKDYRIPTAAIDEPAEKGRP